MKIKKNGKVINLTESDLKRIVKRVLTEQVEEQPDDHEYRNRSEKRYEWINRGLTTLPDPMDISPNVQVITLWGNNISNLDLSGYEGFTELFLLSLHDNPIETINVESVINTVNFTGLSRFRFSYIPTEENEEQVEYINNYFGGMIGEPYNDENL